MDEFSNIKHIKWSSNTRKVEWLVIAEDLKVGIDRKGNYCIQNISSDNECSDFESDSTESNDEKEFSNGNEEIVSSYISDSVCEEIAIGHEEIYISDCENNSNLDSDCELIEETVDISDDNNEIIEIVDSEEEG